jgi:hypothetical protein
MEVEDGLMQASASHCHDDAEGGEDTASAADDVPAPETQHGEPNAAIPRIGRIALHGPGLL